MYLFTMIVMLVMHGPKGGFRLELECLSVCTVVHTVTNPILSYFIKKKLI